MTVGDGNPPDLPEGVAVLKKPFSTEKLILAVQAALALSAELAARMLELAERNQQLRTELEEAVQKASKGVESSIEGLRIS